MSLDLPTLNRSKAHWNRSEHMPSGCAWAPILLATALLVGGAAVRAQQAEGTEDFPFTEEEANYPLFWELVTDMELYVQARECAQRGALDPSLLDALSERIGQKHAEAKTELAARMEDYAESQLVPEFEAASAADIEKGCRSLEDTVRQD
jgi:hypothetical protein